MIQKDKCYKPSILEDYMNDRQIEYFKKKLIKWKKELTQDSVETLQNLKQGCHNEHDMNDRASIETNRSLELRTRDREYKLIAKIDDALARIDNGSYGYCEHTGVPIGLLRLEARPIATLCLEEQERHELMEKIHRNNNNNY